MTVIPLEENRPNHAWLYFLDFLEQIETDKRIAPRDMAETYIEILEFCAAIRSAPDIKRIIDKEFMSKELHCIFALKT